MYTQTLFGTLSVARWWRDEDPYWPLREWGDHPMRWWTLAFGILLALGGLLAHVSHSQGAPEALHLGFGCGALLVACSGAMSDMKNFALGDWAVKAAWATCLALAVKEYYWGWEHQNRYLRRPREPRVSAFGTSCISMCALYMWSGMSGLWRFSLPLTPGAVFKSEDSAMKQKVWELWGYGDAAMP